MKHVSENGIKIAEIAHKLVWTAHAPQVKADRFYALRPVITEIQSRLSDEDRKNLERFANAKAFSPGQNNKAAAAIIDRAIVGVAGEFLIIAKIPAKEELLGKLAHAIQDLDVTLDSKGLSF